MWRHDKAAAAPLEPLAKNAKNPAVRVQALWTLEQLDGLTNNAIAIALADKSPPVRAAAVRLAESRLSKVPVLGAAVLGLVDDADPDVQLQVAYTLGEWRDKARVCSTRQTRGATSERTLPGGRSAQFGQPGEFVRRAAQVLATRPPAADLSAQLLSMAAAGGNQRILGEAIAQLCTPVEGRYADWQTSAVASALAELRRTRRPLAEVARRPGHGTPGGHDCGAAQARGR